MLLSTEQLQPIIDKDNLVIVDCRFNLADSTAGERAYLQGHIPGARYANLDLDLSSPVTPDTGRHPLPDPDELSRKLGLWGIDSQTQVVVYDNMAGAFALRLWWLLKWLGHEQVSLLDGGLPKWLAEGRPMSESMPTIAAKTFTGRPDNQMWVSSVEVFEYLNTGDWQLVDARAENRFLGKEEPIDPVAGHIPGAINYPFQNNLLENGCFKPVEVLRPQFMALCGEGRTENMIHMCGSGVTACHNLFAMELAGIKKSRLYVGSWSEWIRNPAYPVESQGTDKSKNC